MISAEVADFISGLILMTVLGLSIGNYATSIVYRLPRGLKIANDPPYCECERRMYLEVRDNFPFFSWLMSRGKCRWCDIRIPALYAMVELGCGVLFVTALWRFGVGDALVIVLALGVFLITQCALYYEQKRLYTIMVLVVAGLGAMYRILQDDTVFDFIRAGFLAMFIAVLLWRVRRALAKDASPMPDYVVLLGVAGACVGMDALGGLLVLSLLLWLVFRVVAKRYPSFAAPAACFATALSSLALIYNPQLVSPLFQLILP